MEEEGEGVANRSSEVEELAQPLRLSPIPREPRLQQLESGGSTCCYGM